MKKASANGNARYAAFLRRLRAGGRSNMFGAIPYLMSAFALDRDSAYRVVCDWLDQQAAAARDDPASARLPGRTPPPRGRPLRRASTTT
jgi:hypothetical protein